MNKIRRVSLIFRILFQITFIVMPILLAIEWLNMPKHTYFHGIMIADVMSHQYPVLGPFSLLRKTLGFFVDCIPLAINLLVIYFLIKLFRLYEQGEIFSIKNVNYIRNIGYILLIGQCVHPIYDALMSIILTWNNHLYGAKRYIVISFSGTNLGIILIALLVILVSWIMAEGCKLREESQLTI